MDKKNIGNLGEKLAESFLREKGYRILAKNCKISYYEIDILAKIKDFYVFVEVKTRTNKNLGEAIEAITAQKLRYLKKAALVFAYQRKVPGHKLRIDAIAIDMDMNTRIANIRHYISIV